MIGPGSDKKTRLDFGTFPLWESAHAGSYFFCLKLHLPSNRRSISGREHVLPYYVISELDDSFIFFVCFIIFDWSLRNAPKEKNIKSNIILDLKYSLSLIQISCQCLLRKIILTGTSCKIRFMLVRFNCKRNIARIANAVQVTIWL